MSDLLDATSAEVQACPYGPTHMWLLEFRAPEGKKLTPDSARYYECQVCPECRAIRCSSSGGPDDHDRDRCVFPRHHSCDHETRSGLRWPVGG